MLHNEDQIQKKYSMDNYQTKVTELACLCHERLYSNQNSTGPFSLKKQKYNAPVYQELKQYIRKRDPNADQKFTVYQHCQHRTKCSYKP